MWSHVTLHFKRPFLDLRVITQVCSPLLELLSEFMDLIVEKPHQSPLPAIWFEENFFSSSDTRTSAHLMVSDALVYCVRTASDDHSIKITAFMVCCCPSMLWFMAKAFKNGPREMMRETDAFKRFIQGVVVFAWTSA
uniref:Uncharacterized protein n=2 Tax=Populus alba TaxID=43335 RepID=A0A4U5QDN9_POPAL|nr:hypothetical protein D5086_0000099170 [Populus alba]